MGQGTPKGRLLCLCALGASVALGCGRGNPVVAEGELTAVCDGSDATLCLLPWPSGRFLRRDAATATGLRLEIGDRALPDGQDPVPLNRADGFSRATPVMTAFEGMVTAPGGEPRSDGPMRLLLAKPQHEAYATGVPLSFLTAHDKRDGVVTASLLVGHPQRVLEPDARYVAVVLDDLEASLPTALRPSRATLLALGIEAPSDPEEGRLAAYHAPTRAVLKAAGIDPTHVVRVWDFHTRSAADATAWVAAVRERSLAAVDNGEVTAVVDTVEIPATGPVAMVVLGQLQGLPRFQDETGLFLDSSARPTARGVTAAPFRIAVPVGTGDYAVVIYGHGAGGNYTQATLDREVTSAGAAKLGVAFYGWSSDETVASIASLADAVNGSSRAVARLLQALADIAAIQRALRGEISALLAAPTIGGVANPTTGRRPSSAPVVWIGHSFGATAGFAHVSAEPEIGYAVLVASGAAWTQWMPESGLWDSVLEPLLAPRYGGAVGAMHILGVTQSLWDPVDGAVWDRVRRSAPLTALVIESVGDPFMPNSATQRVASLLDAVLVGEPIAPPLDAPWVRHAEGASAITQYRAADVTGAPVHDLALLDHPAGRAAREQMIGFVESVWAGAPRVEIPSGCSTTPPADRCEF